MSIQYHGPQHSEPTLPAGLGYPCPVPHPGAPPGHPAAGYPMAGYPMAGHPMAGHPMAGPVRPDVAPGPVKTAFWLLMGQIVLSAITTLLTVMALVEGGGHAQLGATTYTGSPALFVVGFLLGNGVWALFAAMMLKGHNWSRIVITVLVALGVVSTLFTLLSGVVFLLIGLASLGLGITAVVLMYRRDAHPWFARTS